MTQRQAKAEVALMLLRRCRQALGEGECETHPEIKTPQDAERMKKALAEFGREMFRRSENFKA